MIFNIAIDIFVKAQKSRDSMPLPAPRGTESGFKLSSLSSQWPKARRVRGGGRQAGRHGDCKGSPLSRHVVSQRLPFGLESTALSACVCVCVYLCPGARTPEGVREGGTIAVWVASTSAAIDSLVHLLHCSSIAVSVTCIKFNWIAREGECANVVANEMCLGPE